MTNEELADALKAITEPNYALGIGDIYRIHAAADTLRAMPEGERIEGVVIEEEKIGDLHRIVIHQRDPDMADPYGYARATVILHKRKEEECDEQTRDPTEETHP